MLPCRCDVQQPSPRHSKHQHPGQRALHPHRLLSPHFRFLRHQGEAFLGHFLFLCILFRVRRGEDAVMADYDIVLLLHTEKSFLRLVMLQRNRHDAVLELV